MTEEQLADAIERGFRCKADRAADSDIAEVVSPPWNLRERDRTGAK